MRNIFPTPRLNFSTDPSVYTLDLSGTFAHSTVIFRVNIQLCLVEPTRRNAMTEKFDHFSESSTLGLRTVEVDEDDGWGKDASKKNVALHWRFA
jgi:hypothetical protein